VPLAMKFARTMTRSGPTDAIFIMSNPNRSCTDSLNFGPLRVREAEFFTPVRKKFLDDVFVHMPSGS
jgi:hypothetical protein